jgi:hypothetical protein
MQEFLTFITSGIGNYAAVLLFVVLIVFTLTLFINAVIDKITAGVIAVVFAWKYQIPPNAVPTGEEDK